MLAIRCFFIGAHLLAKVRRVRATLNSRRTVTIPGVLGITVGIIGLAASVLACTAAFRAHWLEVWLLAAPVAAGVAGITLTQRRVGPRARRLEPEVLRFIAHLLPSLLAGAALTALACRAGFTHLVPGVWLLLYGCALLHASTVASRGLAILGTLFAVLALAAFELPQSQQLAVLGLGFGELHILHGVVTLRTGAA
jgi:hypothetical protein